MTRAFRASSLRVRALSTLLLAISFLSARAPGQPSSEVLHGLTWRLIGPHRGGRVTAVSGIAGNTQIYYMGTPGGGVWKTTNAGRTWEPIFDQAHVASIGDVVVAPSDPRVVYVATGEQTDGNGLWKSTDAGATWTNLGFADSPLLPSVLVDPRDANLVYLAVVGKLTPSESRGIFKSSDGGKTWRKVFYRDDHSSPTELDFDPNDAHTIVAVIRRLPPASGEKPSEQVDTELLRSTDSGETWTPMGEQGLPPAHRQRVGLAIAPGTGGKRIFALMAQGLFRSDDSGASWSKITSDPRVLGSNYFGRVYSDPQDSDTVYVMQTSTYRSSDGGRTFAAWKGTPSGEDDHVLWIDPQDPNHILEGTDQGAVVTYDCGKTWSTWFNQPTGQFYRVSTDRGFPYRLYASQQDSGSIVVPSRTDFGLITYRDWFSSGSFESSFIAPDPLDPNYVFSLGWYGNVVRMDRNTGQIATLFIAPRNYRNSWETPITFSPRDPHVLYYASQFLLKTTDGGQTWKEVSPDLTVKPSATSPTPKSDAAGHIPSKEEGENSGSFWKDEDGDDPAQGAPVRGFVQSIAPSPLDPSLIWIGTSTGLIQRSRDGSSWSDVTPAGLPEHSFVNAVEPSPHDPNMAYAAVFVRRDAHPYFYRTADAGKSWQKIVTGLPEAGIARVVREDPLRKGMLFAGTETGMYISYDCGEHWQSPELGLPTTSVRDLTIHGDDLVAATFGRGLWILDDISPLRQWTESVEKSSVHLFTPEPAVRTHWDNHPDTPLQRDTAGSKNPPDGALVYYYLASRPKGEITLEVLDENGVRIERFSSIPKPESLPPANVPEYWFYPPEVLPTAAGVNRFVWNLEYPHPSTLPFGFFGERLAYTEYTLPDHAVPGETPRYQPPGPLVSPGTYDLVLTVDGKAYRQKLHVTADPRVHLSAADYRAGFDLSKKLCDLMEASAVSFHSLAPIEDQFADRKKSMPANAPKELTDAFAAAQKQAEELLSGGVGNPGFGTINRDSGRYLEMVQAADIAPTESVRGQVQQTCEAFAADTARSQKFAAETLPSLNQLLEAQKLSPMAYTPAAAPGPSCTP